MHNRNDSDKTLSHWDLLPVELKENVFQYASPLTQFLNGPRAKTAGLSRTAIRAIWLEAFDIDWHGDLSLLPDPSPPMQDGGLMNSDLARVKTRNMYDRLCLRLPDATESNTSFATADKSAQISVTQVKPHENRLNTDGIKYEQLRLLHIPMRHMWMDIFGDRIRQFPYACVQDCILEGHTELLKHLINSDLVNPLCIRNVAECYGAFQSNYASMDVVVYQGHLDVLKVLHDAGCNFITTSAMNYSAQKGHLDAVKWLHENRTEGCTTYAMDTAAKNGHIDVVKWLHENRTEGCTTRAMDWAAKNGGLDVVKWLHENRTEGCTTDAMDDAAINGNLDIVMFLHFNRSEGCTTKAMDWAANTGHLDVIKFLSYNRIEGCTTIAMDDAAKNGHLDLVKWLHGNRTEACTKRAMDSAAEHGHLDVVNFLHENRTEGCTSKAMDDAASEGHLNVVKFLHENRTEGCTTKAMDWAAAYGHFDVVKWLHENRFEGCTHNAMDNASKWGELDLVKWLHENRSEGCTTEAIDMAAHYGHVEVVRFLLDNRTEGFTDEILKWCDSSEIAQMLVQSMTFERRRAVVKIARSQGWRSNAVEILKKNLSTRIKNPNKSGPSGFMGKARASISKLFSGFR